MSIIHEYKKHIEAVIKEKVVQKSEDCRYRVIRNAIGYLNVYIASSHYNALDEEERVDDFYQMFDQPSKAIIEQIINQLELVTPEEMRADALIEKQFDEQKWIAPRLHLNTWLERPQQLGLPFVTGGDEPVKLPKPLIATFYSYKGGVGRTTALAVCAAKLARAGKKVIVVDFDLEAPGLATFLTPSQVPVKGVVDYLIEKRILNGVKHFRDFFLEAPEFSGKGQLYLMPAGKVGLNYLEDFACIDFDLYARSEDNPVEELLREIQDTFQPDAILLDSRTGLADIGGTLLFRLSDWVVFFFYNNSQNLDGLQVIFETLLSKRAIDEPTPKALFVNSIIPYNSGGDVAMYDDFKERLYRLFWDYEIYTEDSDAPDEDDRTAEHYPLFIRRNERLNFPIPETFTDLLTETQNDFQPLFEQLLEACPETPDGQVPANLLSTGTKREILDELNFGEAIAEDEDYASSDYFQAKFLPRRNMRYIFDERYFIAIGAKGTGKSTLYRVLQNNTYSEVLRKFLSREVRGLNLFDGSQTWVSAHGKVSSETPYFLESTDFQTLSSSETTNPTDYWKRFWLIYAYQCLERNSELRLKPVLEPPPTQSRADWIRRLGEVLKEKENYYRLDEILQKLSDDLKKDNHRVYLLYDHLDASFSNNIELRKQVVEGLVSLWTDKIELYDSIIPKIFLRKDIFDSLELQNKSHIRNRTINLEWTKADLFRLVIKRAISSSDKLRSLYDQMDIHFDQIKDLGYQIPDDEETLKRLVHLLFGERVSPGEKKAQMYRWFENHLADGNGVIYPRDMVTLMKEAHQIEQNRDIMNPTSILIGDSITKAMPEVSNKRLAALREEYPGLVKVFDVLQEHSIFVPIDREELAQILTEIEVQSSVSSLEQLVDIGLIKEYGKQRRDPVRYTIPDLYLYGLNAKRRGPR
jgi:cellulose biosynthesis protein BcsQ